MFVFGILVEFIIIGSENFSPLPTQRNSETKEAHCEAMKLKHFLELVNFLQPYLVSHCLVRNSFAGGCQKCLAVCQYSCFIDNLSMI
jgi:hypothetical protein